MNNCTDIESRFRHWLLGGFCHILLWISLTAPVFAQGTHLDRESVETLIDQLKQGTFSAATLDQLARRGAIQAIPSLREQFRVREDIFTKEALASTLIRLGDKEQTYWSFLAQRAQEAIESDAPFPILFDSQGKLVSGQMSPEFSKWARSHKLDPEIASRTMVYELPISLAFVARTGDPKSAELLRKAMSSRNYFIQAIAAKGLAKLQDTSSIPLIIQACKNAPSEMAAAIAYALVFFNTPEAQAAAETFINDREVLAELRKLSREKGINGLF